MIAKYSPLIILNLSLVSASGGSACGTILSDFLLFSSGFAEARIVRAGRNKFFTRNYKVIPYFWDY